MKKTLTQCLTAGIMLLSSSFVHAQSTIEINESNLSAYGMISGNVVTLQSGQNYVVNADLTASGISHLWSNRELKIEDGATLTIQPGAKMFVMKFAKSGSAPAGTGVFNLNLHGQFTCSESEIATAGVNITINNGGLLCRGGSDGSIYFGDLKFSSTSEDNIVTILEGGLLKSNVLTIGNGSVSSPIGSFVFENNGTMDINGNINMNAVTVIRNNETGYIYIDNQFELNSVSKFINCGHVYSQQAYNLNGGEIINTNYFESANAMIAMGSHNGGIIRNYGYMKSKSINISSTGAAGYNTYLYNEGRIELMESNDNVFGSHVGYIKGPESANKKGYFILHSTNRTTIGSVNVSGNLNFYQVSATSHNGMVDIFRDYPSTHNVDLNSVTFYQCDGSSTCTDVLSIPAAGIDYEACTDIEGRLPTLVVTVSHDPEGNGSFSGTSLDADLDVYSYIIDATNDVIYAKSALVYNPATNKYISNLSSFEVSGNQMVPEQKDFSGFIFLISPTDVALTSSPSLLIAGAPGTFALTVSNENDGLPTPGGLRTIENVRLNSVNFGVQLPPNADDKTWSPAPYVIATNYELGLGSGSELKIELSGTDEDGTIEQYRVTALPNADTAILYYNGIPVTTSTLIEDLNLLEISFVIPAPVGVTKTFGFEYATIDNAGAESQLSATYLITIGVTDPLALENILLSASNKGNTNLLKWEIIHTDPTNIQSIQIEKSADANAFTSIGKVEVINNTKAQYQFEDPTPFAHSYYRIAVIDASGKKAYSNVINVNAATQAINIYPNPTQADLYITFTKRGTYTIAIVDVTGKVVYQNSQNIDNAGTIKIQNNNFQTGIYMIQITDESGNTQSQKVIIK